MKLMEHICRITPEIHEILEESAQRDMSKLLRQKKLFVIMVGSPRSGKSSFVKSFVIPRSRGIKVVDTDEISLMFTKDPNVRHRGSTQLATKKIEFGAKNKWGDSILYDSTGRDLARISAATSIAKKNGYNVVVIQVIAPLKDTLDRNAKSPRQVDEPYLKAVWAESQAKMKYIYKIAKPMAYFVVFNSDQAPIGWYRYNGQKVTKEENELPSLSSLVEAVMPLKAKPILRDFIKVWFQTIRKMEKAKGTYNARQAEKDLTPFFARWVVDPYEKHTLASWLSYGMRQINTITRKLIGGVGTPDPNSAFGTGRTADSGAFKLTKRAISNLQLRRDAEVEKIDNAMRGLK